MLMVCVRRRSTARWSALFSSFDLRLRHGSSMRQCRASGPQRLHALPLLPRRLLGLVVEVVLHLLQFSVGAVRFSSAKAAIICAELVQRLALVRVAQGEKWLVQAAENLSQRMRLAVGCAVGRATGRVVAASASDHPLLLETRRRRVLAQRRPEN